MGLLVEGQWQVDELATSNGDFKRKDSVFRDWVRTSGDS